MYHKMINVSRNTQQNCCFFHFRYNAIIVRIKQMPMQFERFGRSPEMGSMSEREQPVAETKEEKEEQDLEEVTQLYARKLREGRIGNLIKVMLSDPTTRERFLDIHKDKMVNFEEETFGDSPEKVSSVVVSMMRDRELREVFIKMIDEENAEKTHLLHDAIKASNVKFERSAKSLDEEDIAALVYDEVNIGAGVHGAIYANAMAQENLDVKTLTVDRFPHTAGQFRNKKFVDINSPNVPHERTTPQPMLGKGNLNSMGRRAPVQMPYIESERFPTGNVFGELAEANMFLSNSEVMVKTTFDHVVKPQDDPKSKTWPARYKVVFADGTYVFANRINKISGLGEPNLPSGFDEESKKVFASGSKRVGDEPPTLDSYEGLVDYIDDPTVKFPRRKFAGKTIVFGGSGDSTMTAIEFFLGFADKLASKDDVMNAGLPKKIVIISSKGISREKYMSWQKNARYLQITLEMPDPDLGEDYKPRKLEGVEGYIDQVRLAKGVDEKYRFLVSSVNPQTGQKELKEVFGDFGYLATGYIDRQGEAFGFEQGTNPFADPEYAEPIVGQTDDLPYQMTIGVKLKDEEIYSLGPGSLGRVVEESERQLTGNTKTPLSPTTGTRVSVGTWGPRTELMAKRNAQMTTEKPLPRYDFHEPDISLEINPDERSEVYTVNIDSSTIERPGLTTEIEMKASVADILDQYVFPGVKCERLRITFKRESPSTRGNAGEFAISITFAPDLDDKNEPQIVDRLLEEAVCSRAVSMIGRGRWNALEIDVPIKRNGKAKVPEITISKKIIK